MHAARNTGSSMKKRLHIFNPFIYITPFFKNRIPGQLIIQYTDRCNARCPQCGMRVTEQFRRSMLDMDVTKKIIDSAAEKGIKALSFTGGEPMIFLDKIVELLKYAHDTGIKYTRTGTNGFIFMNPDNPDYEERITKIAGALTESNLYTFWISIDSYCPDTHENMRGLPGVISGIKKALPIFHKHGIYPSANLGINRNMGGSPPPSISNPVEFYESFRDAFRRYYEFIIGLGFTMVNACYPMSIDNGNGLDAVYGATSESPVVQFSSDEKALVFKALLDTIPEYRDKIRIFSPRVSLYSLIRRYTVGEEYCYPCRGGIDFFFIDARDGNTYPCGYRGKDNLGKFWDLDMEKIDKVPSCRKCDWECFIDPSELLGPLLSLMKKPLAFFERAVKDSDYFRIWMQDIKYFSACNFFDGRIPPDYKRLADHKKPVVFKMEK
jgi:MoaA/NifB/PqqE/SkfB family radical SAM enzyme